MNKKIKIIDLFNKIVNGEEVPKRIEYQDRIFEKSLDNDYTTDDGVPLVHLLNYNLSNLNDEVEILEDNTEEIILLNLEKYSFDSEDEFAIDLVCKINEIATAINKMKEGKE